jgi:hypothetical protein
MWLEMLAAVAVGVVILVAGLYVGWTAGVSRGDVALARWKEGFKTRNEMAISLREMDMDPSPMPLKEPRELYPEPWKPKETESDS